MQIYDAIVDLSSNALYGPEKTTIETTSSSRWTHTIGECIEPKENGTEYAIGKIELKTVQKETIAATNVSKHDRRVMPESQDAMTSGGIVKQLPMTPSTYTPKAFHIMTKPTDSACS